MGGGGPRNNESYFIQANTNSSLRRGTVISVLHVIIFIIGIDIINVNKSLSSVQIDLI